MTTAGGKKRFSLKLPNDEGILRFGSCDPNDDDDRDILKDSSGSQHLVATGGKSLKIPCSTIIMPGTMWTNGYYDYEHDGWKPMSEWV